MLYMFSFYKLGTQDIPVGCNQNNYTSINIMPTFFFFGNERSIKVKLCRLYFTSNSLVVFMDAG